MSGIDVKTFLGMRPSVDPDALERGEATIATNVRLNSGALEPLLALSSNILSLTSASAIQTVYRYGQTTVSDTNYWWQFNTVVDIVKGPNVNDTEERTYWTDGTYPKKANATLAIVTPPYPTSSLRMGLPAPTPAVSAATSGVATDATDPAQSLVYVVTYVSSWGEEGPPSAASTPVTWRPGQTVNLTSIPVAPAGAYDVTFKRIYRSAVGSNSTKFQLVTATDLAVATTTYNDTTLTAALGETLATTGWVAPPDTMTGLRGMPNGIMVGFVNNTVCFCEPSAPYAWPTRYQYALDGPVVAVGVYGQQLLVSTARSLYVAMVTDPATVNFEKQALAQVIASKRSVVEMLNGVLFASPDGLWHWSGGSAFVNITDKIMAIEDWRAYVPSSIHAYEIDSAYIGFYDTGSVTGSLVFRFGGNLNATFTTSDIYATAGFRDKARDLLFVCAGGAGANQIKKWDFGSAATYSWTAGTFHLESPVNMACARVDAVAYPVTFKLYADGALKHTETVANNFAFRLPAEYRSFRYSFNLSGTSTVRRVEIATSMRELARG